MGNTYLTSKQEKILAEACEKVARAGFRVEDFHWPLKPFTLEDGGKVLNKIAAHGRTRGATGALTRVPLKRPGILARIKHRIRRWRARKCYICGKRFTKEYKIVRCHPQDIFKDSGRRCHLDCHERAADELKEDRGYYADLYRNR